MFSWTMLIWIGIGALAGLAARKLIGGEPPFGRLGDALLGMAGGAAGGILIALIGDLGNFVWVVGSIVTALLGALLLIWIVGFFKRMPA